MEELILKKKDRYPPSRPFCQRRPVLLVRAVPAFLSAPSRPSCRRRPGLLVNAVPAFLSAPSRPGLFVGATVDIPALFSGPPPPWPRRGQVVKLSSCKLE